MSKIKKKGRYVMIQTVHMEEYFLLDNRRPLSLKRLHFKMNHMYFCSCGPYPLCSFLFENGVLSFYPLHRAIYLAQLNNKND